MFDWLKVVTSRIHGSLARRELDKDFQQELDVHLEMLTEENIRQGLPPEEARRAARLRLGGSTQLQEAHREVWSLPTLETFVQDLRYGLRQLRRNPGFTTVAVLTLALGIGANTAIFTAMDTVMLKLLPVSHPEQLVLLQWQSPHGVTDYLPYPTFEQLRKHNRVLAGMFAFHNLQLATQVDRVSGLAAGQLVSGNYFSVLGAKALIGRTFTSGEDRVLGADPFAVISYRYWENRLGRDPAVVGSPIELNGAPFTIIGVMPPAFFGVTVGEACDVWIPLMMQVQVMDGKSLLHDPKSWWLQVMARRKRGISEQQAIAGLDVLYQRIARQQAGAQLSLDAGRELAHEEIGLLPASRGLSNLRDRMSKPLIVLMILVSLVLLVACANIASLVLARATARQREMAVRAALGAGRPRLFRQLLTESLLVAGLGGALGLLFARWGDDLLLELLSRAGAPVALSLQLDFTVFMFTACVALLTGVLFGTAPAWKGARIDLNAVIKASVRGLATAPGTARSRWGLRKLLVTGEVAMALLLLVGAGMLVRSLRRLKGVDPGFNQNNVLLVSIDPTLIGYRGNRLINFYRQVTLAIPALPGVLSASLSALPPMTRAQWRSGVFIQGHIPGPHERTTARMNFVGPRFFHTLGIPLFEGREFTPEDNGTAPKVAIINEAMAQFYFGKDSAVGKRLSFFSPESGEIEIVGVAKDTKYTSLRESPPHMVYVPYLQTPPASLAYGMTLEVRTAGNADGAAGAVRQAIRTIDRGVPILGFTTLAEQVSESLAQERLVAQISSFFGLLALLLASIGLYGVMTYTVAQRTGEIGIRMALGARRAQVLWMVLREALELVGIGAVFGVPLSIAFARLISGQLYGITPADPLTIFSSTALLVSIALIASYIPARRAARVDPMVALRHE